MRVFFSLVLVLIAVGCESRSVDVTIKNASSETIDDARIESPDFESSAGVIDPGMSKTEISITKTLPGQVDVKWRNSAGTTFSRRVTVPDLGYGELIFEIHSDSTVKVIALAPGGTPVN